MRIHITGASGSGTSTLASELAKKINYACLDADDYFWKKTEPQFTIKRNREERLNLLIKDIANAEDSVLAGSIDGWGKELEDSFDLIVFLYLDTALRINRLREREMKRFGKVNENFIEWASQYDTGKLEGRSLERQLFWIQQRTCPVIRIEGDLSVSDKIELVLKNMPNHQLQPIDTAEHYR